MTQKQLHKNFFLTKIFRRIFFLFAGSLIILILGYSYITIQMQKKSSLEVLHSKAQTLARSIALVCNDAILKDDMSFIVEYTLNVVKNNKDIAQIIITNTSHNNIIVTQKSWRMFTKVNAALFSMQKNREFYALRYDKELKEKVFHYVYPVKVPGIDWGYIHIVYKLGEYNAMLQSIYRSILTLLSLTFIIVFLISYVISREIALPILKLTRAAEEIKSGNLHVSVNIKSNDEISEFAKNFNDMVHKLSHSHEELEELVAIRTEALEKLNQELDVKIKTAIEENSQKEQMLIQQSRLAAMGEMIGNIAHQWRQPLNALGLVVQNIYYTYDAGELDKEYLERAMNKSKKLTTLMSKTIDDFRNFFRPDKIQERFKISERIDSVAELVMASYKNHNIVVTMELDDELESLGYPNEFSQVLLNVLTNAKDALIERKIELPKVIVRSFAQEEKVVVEIEDNAGGIDEDIISKIFDPYFTTKDKSVGTGIGLYMSKMIIENNMHGEISVYNSKNGAVFRMEINFFKEERINAI